MTDTPSIRSEDPATLENHIMDSRVAKSATEWWAAREIDKLREQLAGADALISTHQFAIDPSSPETWPSDSLLKAAVERHAKRK